MESAVSGVNFTNKSSFVTPARQSGFLLTPGPRSFGPVVFPLLAMRGNLSAQCVSGCLARCDVSRSTRPSGSGAEKQKGGGGVLRLWLGTNHSAFHHYYPPSLSLVAVSIWGDGRERETDIRRCCWGMLRNIAWDYYFRVTSQFLC